MGHYVRQELTEAVANCPNAGLVATLISQLAEFMDEGAERAYESLEKVLGRIEKWASPPNVPLPARVKAQGRFQMG